MNNCLFYDRIKYTLYVFLVGDFMSNNNKDKNKYINVTINKRKREKFLKPLITEEEFNGPSDAFFSVVKNNKQNNKQSKSTNNDRFYISPMRGKVADRSTFPVTTSKGKIDKQYDFIRKQKKLNENELHTQYGSKYYEFNLYKNQNQPQQKVKNTEFEDVNRQEPAKITVNEKASTNSVEKLMKPDPIEFNEEMSIIDKNRVNIIYEEEIELEDDRQVLTSFDENNRNNYYGDYDKNYRDYKVNLQNKNVHVSQYNTKEDKIRAEIKQMFAEFHDEHDSKSPVYFEEEFSFNHDEEEQVPVRRPNKKPEVTFTDLKKEMDESIKKERKKPEVQQEAPSYEDYKFPPLDLLTESTEFQDDQLDWINDQIDRLDATLESFGIAARTVNYTIGPSVTRFEVEPEPGTKVSKITTLSDDIKLRLAASDVFIEAPISGKSTVGIEVPNLESRMVVLREILESNTYKMFKSPLKIALGLDITGEAAYSDISTMTHSLIAGSTGSGKSVCINTLIVSILYNAMPDEVKLVLIDPKKVEFSLYRDIPHLLTPVINDSKVATATLRWLTEEMDRRYELIESVGARDIKSYNLKRGRSIEELPKLPYIVVIIDELADLMMVAANEVEEYIQRISQLARAAGIHLIVATQRPSTNVITGTIKTNIPTRISFKVASAIDSRIILDDTGAEKLLGKGDMLLHENGKAHAKRLQGSFISDEEIERVTLFCKDQAAPVYEFTGEDLLKKETEFVMDYEDDLFDDVVRFVIDLGEASASRIQRHFKVGYNRAARMIDMMEKYNIIGPQQNGSKPRDVLMSIESYEDMIYS